MFKKLYYIFHQEHKKYVEDLKKEKKFLEKELHETQVALVNAIEKNDKMRYEIKKTREYAESVYNKYNHAADYAKREMDRCIHNHRIIVGDVEKLEKEIKELEKIDIKISHNYKKYLTISE